MKHILSKVIRTLCQQDGVQYSKDSIPESTKFQKRELVKSYLLRLMQLSLFWLPVKRNRIMVYVHARRGFSCNPKYVVKKLHSEYGADLEIIWTTLYPESCQELEELGISVMAANSSQAIKTYFRTRVYITNDAFPSWAGRRLNQKWINTWHGGMNYKHIGYEYLPPMSKCEQKLFRIRNREADVYLSGSRFFTQNTSDSFDIDIRKFIPTGLPRNDLFFEEREDLQHKIRDYYGINRGTKIVLFAPTFRKELCTDMYGIDIEQLLAALEEKFGGHWQFFFRNHCFVTEKQMDCRTAMTDVSEYADMQELLYVADVLISDYSSCMWDFCHTKRPCFVYANDMEHYCSSDRDFAYPIEKWPFPVATTNEQLRETIANFSIEEYREKITKHLQEMGCYDTGNASGQVADLIQKYCMKNQIRFKNRE